MLKFIAQYSNGDSLNIAAADRSAALDTAKAHLRTLPRGAVLTELYPDGFWNLGN